MILRLKQHNSFSLLKNGVVLQTLGGGKTFSFWDQKVDFVEKLV